MSVKTLATVVMPPFYNSFVPLSHKQYEIVAETDEGVIFSPYSDSWGDYADLENFRIDIRKILQSPEEDSMERLLFLAIKPLSSTPKYQQIRSMFWELWNDSYCIELYDQQFHNYYRSISRARTPEELRHRINVCLVWFHILEQLAEGNTDIDISVDGAIKPQITRSNSVAITDMYRTLNRRDLFARIRSHNCPLDRTKADEAYFDILWGGNG